MNDSSSRFVSVSELVHDQRLGPDSHPGGLSPVRLPHVRDQVARFLRDRDTPMAQDAPESVPYFDLVADHLGVADLYWVTPDMSALSVAAGAQLDTIRWPERPSGCGLIVFAGGIGMVQYAREGAELPVDAMTWGPSPDGYLLVTMFCGRWRLSANIVENQPVQTPPLVLVGGDDFRGGDGELPVTGLPEDARTVLSTLAAAWSLMAQPTIASRTEAPVNRKLVRAYRRAGRPTPTVSIIDLRTLYRPSTQESADTGRTYRHRWVVRGHWRDQPHGPGAARRKRIYVPSYIKGPDGAPLLARERVNVWRR